MLIYKKVKAHELIEINLLMPMSWFTKNKNINDVNSSVAAVVNAEGSWEE